MSLKYGGRDVAGVSPDAVARGVRNLAEYRDSTLCTVHPVLTDMQERQS